jgi:hypothetical protein
MNLKRVSLSVSLILALAIACFAGEMSAPPCPPPVPGEMQAPPCSSTQLTSDDTVQGQTQTTVTTAVVTDNTITDTAIDLAIKTILSLF